MKLISAESLLKKFDTGALLFESDIRKIIEEEPEAVVRCEDCYLCDCTNSGFMFCERTDQMTTSDGYCKWGVRKSEEDPSHPCADSVMMGD